MNEKIKPNFANVGEAWPLYDTLCVSPNLYGAEANAGWFTTFPAFAANETHSFFKQRTEGSLDLAYTNKQSADTMDYAFWAYSLGVSFFSPGVRGLGKLDGDGVLGPTSEFDANVAHWWETILPRNCAIQLKVNQDIVAELPCMAAPPGYGPSGGGAAFNHNNCGYVPPVPPNGTPGTDGNAGYYPVLNMCVTQGVPSITNRWRFPSRLAIPRTATIEAILHVSREARETLSHAIGPLNYLFPNSRPVDGEGAPYPWTEFASRFGIQVSLIGKRAVQQRGQLHR
jgi:hypothetical protein